MNLLAHALLSPDDPEVLVGNLVADWVKGRARRLLPAGIQAGMALHQAIDVFTDCHRRVEDCVQILYPRWGRYSPILVDVLFDHVLSEHWAEFAPTPRPAVIRNAYCGLRDHVQCLPERARHACHHLIADDWLNCYASVDGIALCLTRLSSRLRMTGHEVELAPAVADYLACRASFVAAFREFFPELRRQVLVHPAFSLA
jgi:acyl carrier protein phosphodiesterase